MFIIKGIKRCKTDTTETGTHSDQGSVLELPFASKL